MTLKQSFSETSKNVDTKLPRFNSRVGEEKDKALDLSMKSKKKKTSKVGKAQTSVPRVGCRMISLQ